MIAFKKSNEDEGRKLKKYFLLPLIVFMALILILFPLLLSLLNYSELDWSINLSWLLFYTFMQLLVIISFLNRKRFKRDIILNLFNKSGKTRKIIIAAIHMTGFLIFSIGTLYYLILLL